MFYVIAKRPIKNAVGDLIATSDETTESGPFETRSEAARFAIGLAKTGQAFETKIEERDPEVLEMVLAAHSALDRLLFDFPDVAKTEHLQNAREALSEAVSELMTHEQKEGGKEPPALEPVLCAECAQEMAVWEASGEWFASCTTRGCARSGARYPIGKPRSLEREVTDENHD